jgi:ribonuclease P protein component
VLDRCHRLTTSGGFHTATRRGRRAGTRTLVLHLAVPEPSPGGDADDPSASGSRGVPCQVGFVVSKAVGNAVTRNRVKRRLRHLSAARLPSIPDRALLVVRALPPAAGATYDAMGRDFDVALRRLDLPVDAREGGTA